MIKFLFYAVLAYALGMLISPAFATGKNHTIIVNNYPTEVTETQLVGNNGRDTTQDIGDAIAMCLGGSQYDYATGWQGSGGGSWYRSSSAVCLGFATRVDNVLINFDAGCDTNFDYCGGTVHGNWHF